MDRKPDDTITFYTEGYLSWGELFKLLLGRKLIVRTKTLVWKKELGISVETTEVAIYAESFRKPKSEGYYEVNLEEDATK